MGSGVAHALLARGFEVAVHDIVPERQALVVSAGAIACASAAEVARRAPLVITLVVDARQTRDVLFGPVGAAQALGPASTVMMCSTIAPGDAEAIARELAARGVAMLDAPISGGPAHRPGGRMPRRSSAVQAL